MSCMFVIVVMLTDGPVYMVEVVFFSYFFCFCDSFCPPIQASRLLGALLAFSSYRGAPIAAWVSPWSKPYASTELKKKKKKKLNSDLRHLTNPCNQRPDDPLSQKPPTGKGNTTQYHCLACPSTLPKSSFSVRACTYLLTTRLPNFETHTLA